VRFHGRATIAARPRRERVACGRDQRRAIVSKSSAGTPRHGNATPRGWAVAQRDMRRRDGEIVTTLAMSTTPTSPGVGIPRDR